MPRVALPTLLAVAAPLSRRSGHRSLRVLGPQSRSAPVSLQTNSLGNNPAPVRLASPFRNHSFPARFSAARLRSSFHGNDHRAPQECDGPSLRSPQLSRGHQIDRWDRSENIRPVIDAIQALPNQREKSIYLGMLVARWAEGEPQAALAYARTTGPASDRSLMVSAAIRAWAEKNATAANAWVLQLPSGQERDRAWQAIVSSLAETDPQAALTMLQTLPAAGQSRQNFYWPIFSRWASKDPVTASQQAALITPGLGHDSAVQVVALDMGQPGCAGRFRLGQCLATGPGSRQCLAGGAYPAGQTGIQRKPPISSRGWRRVPCATGRPEISRGNGPRTIPPPRSAWTQALPTGEGQSRAMQSVLSSWAQSDPTAAADYVAALPSRQDAGGRSEVNRASTRHRRCANRLELGAKTSRGTNASGRSRSDRRAMERDGSGQCR